MHIEIRKGTHEYDPFDEEDEDQEQSLLGEGTFGFTHRMRSKADQQVYAVKMIKVTKAGACGYAQGRDNTTRLVMLNKLKKNMIGLRLPENCFWGFVFLNKMRHLCPCPCTGDFIYNKDTGCEARGSL